MGEEESGLEGIGGVELRWREGGKAEGRKRGVKNMQRWRVVDGKVG